MTPPLAAFPLTGDYTLKPDEIAFLKEQTGITNDEQLKKHVLGIQKDAYAVRVFISTNLPSTLTLLHQICPYPCIRRLSFAKSVNY